MNMNIKSCVKDMALFSPPHTCKRCYYEWVGRIAETPRNCPRCKSPKWNEPRKKAKR